MVSIIIPTYQRSDTLKRAIESCLNQTMDDIEIIVVDDNNPDSDYRSITEKIMADYSDNNKIKYLKHSQNMRGSAARNTGISVAKGEYITFLDDDDVLADNKIERQIKTLESKGEEFGVVCCGVKVCDEDTGKQMRIIQPQREGNVQLDMLKLRFGMGSGSNPLFRRCAIENIGDFDTSFLRQQDTEYMIRVLRNYKLAVVSDVLITKYESGHPNRPSPVRYLDIQKHFMKTFKSDIERYSSIEQNEIYRNNWHQVCIVAIDARDWKLARKCYNIAAKYMKYTFKMKMGMLKHILNNKY